MNLTDLFQPSSMLYSEDVQSLVIGTESLYYGKWRSVRRSAMTLTLIGQSPVSNLHELFSNRPITSI